MADYRTVRNAKEHDTRGFNIADFQTYRKKAELLRTHDFILEVPYPESLIKTNAYTQTWRNLELACESIGFPQQAFSPYKVQRYSYGAVEDRITIPVTGEIQCVFVEDKKSGIGTFFHDWMRSMGNFSFGQIQSRKGPMQAYELSYKEDYVVDLHLYIYDQYGEVSREIQFRKCFPLAVGDVQYSWGRQNEYVKVPVQFSVVDWFDLTP